MKILTVLSYLLSYPEPEWVNHIDELMEEIRQSVIEKDITQEQGGALMGCCQRISSTPLLDLQSDYVEAFDRGRSLSLWVFEHVYGDSSERGKAMNDLIDAYQQQGLMLNSNELPDYLPLILEFLAISSSETVVEWLSQLDLIFGKMYLTAKKISPNYQEIFYVLFSLSQGQITCECQQESDKDISERSLAFIDKQWEEEVVSFLSASAHPSDKQNKHQRQFIEMMG